MTDQVTVKYVLPPTVRVAVGLPPIKVTVAAVGVAGAAGAGAELIDEFVAAAAGAQSFTLTAIPAPGGPYALYVNGLREPTAGYSVSGNQLQIPGGLNLLDGDAVAFQYALPS